MKVREILDMLPSQQSVLIIYSYVRSDGCVDIKSYNGNCKRLTAPYYVFNMEVKNLSCEGNRVTISTAVDKND